MSRTTSLLGSRSLAVAMVLAALAAPAVAGDIVFSLAGLSTDAQLDAAAAELRAHGPAGLAAVLDYHHAHKLSAEDHGRVLRVIDAVAAQRGASVSRLYWYTDLDAARAAAAAAGKPILSLRLLGRLTDEYSCANSRFFRTALYSNQAVSDYLRDHYILHWQSVRPVPRVTVDFGDGRTLCRTLTGNSAHYVLDAEGRPLDALPGLYGPKSFAAWLETSRDLALWLAKVAPPQRAAWLASHHGEQLATLEQSLRNDLARFAPELLADPAAAQETGPAEPQQFPIALQAGKRAVSKFAAEAPLLAPFTPGDAALADQDDRLWRQIAAERAADAALDESSREVIRRENPHPTALAAGELSTSKRLVEDPVLRLVRSFEQTIALDEVKNEYLLHRQIHRWYVAGEVPEQLDPLNDRVYAELFLTPAADPWLGLAPPDAYTALDNAGLSATP